MLISLHVVPAMVQSKRMCARILRKCDNCMTLYPKSDNSLARNFVASVYLNISLKSSRGLRKSPQRKNLQLKLVTNCLKLLLFKINWFRLFSLCQAVVGGLWVPHSHFIAWESLNSRD